MKRASDNSLAQFLAALKHYREKFWWIKEGDLIRGTAKRDGRAFCPITAVVWSHFHLFFEIKHAHRASMYLGFNRRLSQEVRDSADFLNGELREKILESVKL